MIENDVPASVAHLLLALLTLSDVLRASAIWHARSHLE